MSVTNIERVSMKATYKITIFVVLETISNEILGNDVFEMGA